MHNRIKQVNKISKNLVIILRLFEKYISKNCKIILFRNKTQKFISNPTPKFLINPLASSGVGAPALKYRDVNTMTSSPGEVKGLIIMLPFKKRKKIKNFYDNMH